MVTLKHHVYSSSNPGKILVLTGGIHGDERCGPAALTALIAALDNGIYRIECGTLIIVPVCNPRGHAENVRFIDRNLNRYLFPKDPEKRVHYEDHIDPLLCPLLERADMLLDLHSYHSAGNAFIFLGGDNKDETAFVRDLGISDFVDGWAAAYGGGGSDESTGTTEYARRFGALAATLECGQHLNENAAEVGYRACVRAMLHAGLISDTGIIPPSVEQKNQRVVTMRDVIYCIEGGTMAKPYVHFDPVSKGDIIARDADGNACYTAPVDGYIVLPKHTSEPGEEWFYFGAATTFSS